MFFDIHLEEFKKLRFKEQVAVGRVPRKWFEQILKSSSVEFNGLEGVTSLLSSTKVKRSCIDRMVLDQNISTEACCATILAWGERDVSNGQKIFSRLSEWKALAEKIREEGLSRNRSYDGFKKLQQEGRLVGMGPAYYTKLIYFLMAGNGRRGYIMDQWTGRSINLLLAPHPLVIIDRYPNKKTGNVEWTVSNKNDSSVYEEFCCRIEELAEIPEIANMLKLAKIQKIDRASAVEEMLFSEGRGKGEWRNYVKNSG